MLFTIIASYLPYTLVTAYTPGPNNIIALYAVSQKGWRKGQSILIGIGAGFLSVMLLCALFCYELAKYAPSITGILKYIGAAYIIYLAIHVAVSKPETEEKKEMTFLKGFLLEFVNVKIILYAITVYTAYVLPNKAAPADMVLHALVLTAIGVSGNLAWAAAGGIFQKILKKYYLPFNLAMAAILIWCAVTLALDL